jgi:hypothetical protein
MTTAKLSASLFASRTERRPQRRPQKIAHIQAEMLSIIKNAIQGDDLAQTNVRQVIQSAHAIMTNRYALFRDLRANRRRAKEDAVFKGTWRSVNGGE